MNFFVDIKGRSLPYRVREAEKYLRKFWILAGLVTETQAIRLTPMSLAKEVSKPSKGPSTTKHQKSTVAASPSKADYATTALSTTSHPHLASPGDNDAYNIANNPSENSTARVDPMDGSISGETSKGKFCIPSDCLTLKSPAIEVTGKLAP